MKTKEYRKVKVEVDALLDELRDEVRKDKTAPPTFSKQYQEIEEHVKRKILEKSVEDPDDYLREEKQSEGFDGISEGIDNITTELKRNFRKKMDDVYFKGRDEANDEHEERQQDKAFEKKSESVLSDFRKELKNLPRENKQ